MLTWASHQADQFHLLNLVLTQVVVLDNTMLERNSWMMSNQLQLVRKDLRNLRKTIVITALIVQKLSQRLNAQMLTWENRQVDLSPLQNQALRLVVVQDSMMLEKNSWMTSNRLPLGKRDLKGLKMTIVTIAQRELKP